MIEPIKTRKPKTAPKLKTPYISPNTGQVVRLTDNQKQFTDAVLSAPTSEILINRVMEIYQTNRKSAQVITRQNFLKPNIELYLGDRGYKALDVMYEIMTKQDLNSKSPDDTRLAAAKEIADRQFGKATQRTEVNSSKLSIHIDLTGTLEEE